MKTVFVIFGLLLFFATQALAVPVEETGYANAGLRLECRPSPQWFSPDNTFEKMEGIFAASGVQARWLSVVDPEGTPYFKSKFIPSSNVYDTEKNDAIFKAWVADMHKQGMVVLSWYPLIFSKSGKEAHPEWGQVPIIPNPEGRGVKSDCCINTGYGDALINFCNEAIDKYNLDGFWFDGSAWTQIWDRPVGLTCACPACKRLFKQQTGLDLPTKVDWNDPIFRKWVAWRYDCFTDYIGRLANGIRKKHPNAVVVINHYHRPMIPWMSAIPLNPYPADIITGSEAAGEANTDLVSRLCRAYGRGQSEVWRPISPADDADITQYTNEVVHHALTCITAGAMPVYGMNAEFEKTPKIIKEASDVIDRVKPYLSKDSVKYAALHLSQQSETFYFSRDQKGRNWAIEPYWQSVTNWTQGLMQAHISPDYIYDKQFTIQNLKNYKLLILPFSVALSDEQVNTALKFAEQGGTLVLGPASGLADKWGEKLKINRFGAKLGFDYKSIPSPAVSELKALELTNPHGKSVCSMTAYFSPLSLKSKGWRVLYNAQVSGDKSPAVVSRKYGKGNVVVVGVDLGAARKLGMFVDGGDTSITVTDETASTGSKSLRFVDGPNAPQPFYPDLEMTFQGQDPETVASGRFKCALRVDKGAIAKIEIRQAPVGNGVMVTFGRDGKIWAQDKPLCSLPTGKWFSISINYRLTGNNLSYDLMVKVPGEEKKTFTNFSYSTTGFKKPDWLVIYGDGTEKGAFYVDDISMISYNSAGQEIGTIYNDGFEGMIPEHNEPLNPVMVLASDLQGMSVPQIRIDGPDSIRAGMFRKDSSRIFVHLHNINGSLNGQLSKPIKITTQFPVKTAFMEMAGKPLDIKKEGKLNVINVPGISMNEVITLIQ